MNTKQDIPELDSNALNRLLDETLVDAPNWSRQDLKAVFRHQWSAPLAVDLTSLGVEQAAGLKTRAAAEGLLVKSFGDLFAHPSPPVELLDLCKDFAKRCLYSESSVLPHDAARVLYFTAIAVARVRCEKKISRLQTPEIRQGVAWALGRDWLPDESRNVLQDLASALNRESAES